MRFATIPFQKIRFSGWDQVSNDRKFKLLSRIVMKRIYLLILTLLVSAPALTATMAAPMAEQENKEQEQEAAMYQYLETFANVLDLTQQHYIDEVDSKEILINAINGMLTSLDPHSSYMSPEDFTELQDETRGNFSGIGIELTIRNRVLTVVSPIEGTPAYRQGVKAGDQIIKIEGKFTKDMTLNDAVKKMRGKKGDQVTISIKRKGLPELEKFTLVRDVIPHYSVSSMEIAPSILYVRITNFQSTTTRDFRKAINKAGKKKKVEGMILDLRNNPGGLLDQAVKISDVLIDEGIIVSTRGRNPEQDMIFEAHRGSGKLDFPMIVLVNGGSASAAEIVAGALQDQGRAIILGTQTFGKGSVQTVVPLPDGAGLRLTTARYYTPSGVSIQATGIKPDMIVPFEEPDESNNGAREKDLPHHFANGDKDGQEQRKKKEAVDPLDQKKEKARKRLAKDNQLRTALFTLKNLHTQDEQ